MSLPYFEEHLSMHLADCLGSHGIRDVYDFLIDKLENLEEEEIRPRPLIDGNDLIKLGYKPGPLFSEILGKVEEQQLEGILKDREEALSFIRENFVP